MQAWSGRLAEKYRIRPLVWLASPIGVIISLHSFLEVSSSGSQLPGRWHARLALSWRMSRQEPWIVESANEMMTLFRKLNDYGKTIVVVTHDPQIAQHASRVIRFLDGRVQ